MESKIAVIGMAGRFPGAPDVGTFWKNICAGVESVCFFSDEELLEAGVSRSDLAHPQYVKAAATIEDPASFDAAYFGYNQQEAEFLDPQQRLFLQTAVFALEAAGCDPNRFPGAIGVFGGAATNLYQFGLWNKYLRQLKKSPAFTMAMIQGNDTDFLTSRVSYKLGLRGPSVAVQAACSTSLVAVHLACQSLISGESDIALAGGSSIIYSLRKSGYFYEDGGAVSPDGHCRPFDARARGTVFGDGVGIVVLKPLYRALADGDCIHAVILGSAVNNDGAGKVGYSAPGIDGQSGVIAEALAVADVDADSIGFVEAHGTGTQLGDPIEVEALAKAFRGSTERRGYCALGSVKANVGHLNIAAGVTGLIKAVLAVREGKIPATINFRSLNSAIDLGNSPFFINTETMNWPTAMRPRRAGVSSFGIGGSNAHVLVEEPPHRVVSTQRRTAHILGISARTPGALARLSTSVAADVRGASGDQIAAMAHTLANGRALRPCRQAMVLSERDEKRFTAPVSWITSQKRPTGTVAFVFSPAIGGGRMGRRLYRDEPLFRTEIDRCESILHKKLIEGDGETTSGVLAAANLGEDAGAGDQSTLYVTTFAVAIGMVRLWQQWGVEPSAVVGQGIGAVAAGYVAGVFGLPDALRLAISLAQTELLDDRHSNMRESLDQIPLAAPLIPMLSLSTGQWMTAELARDPMIWVRECASLNEGCEGFDCLKDSGHDILLQIGVRVPWAKSALSDDEHSPLALASPLVRDGSESETASFLEAVARLWVAGGPVKLGLPYEGGEYLKTDIASAPFEGVEYGADVIGRITADRCMEVSNAHEPSRAEARMSSGYDGIVGCVTRVWTDLFGADFVNDDSDFFACGGDSLAAVRMCRELSDMIGIEVPISSVAEAPTISQLALYLEELLASEGKVPPLHTLDPSILDVAAENGCGHNETLIARRVWAECAIEGQSRAAPDLHWIVLGEGFEKLRGPIENAFPGVRCRTFGALGGSSLAASYEAAAADVLFTLQLAMRERSSRRVLVQVIVPADAAGWRFSGVAGLLKTAELESRNLFGQVIGLAREIAMTDAIHLLREEAASPMAHEVKYFGDQRLIAEWQEVEDGGSLPDVGSWREGGVYLITGGAGGLGRIFARELITRAKDVTVILTGRSDLDLSKQQLIRRIEEENGNKILYRRMDVANPCIVDAVMSEVENEFGGLNGIIHCAGIIRDSFISNKTRDELTAVFAPKVAGTINLDQASRNHPLDFMILFASGSGSLGNIGQADYAAANSFMDAYAAYRNGLVGQGVRRGTTIAIDWPMWQDGGMKVDDAVIREHCSRGIASLTASAGVSALYQALAAKSEQVLVAYGNVERLRRVHDDVAKRRRARWSE